MLENSFAAAAVVAEAIDEECYENCYSYHDYEFCGLNNKTIGCKNMIVVCQNVVQWIKNDKK